jgi:hypothetical protein
MTEIWKNDQMEYGLVILVLSNVMMLAPDYWMDIARLLQHCTSRMIVS